MARLTEQLEATAYRATRAAAHFRHVGEYAAADALQEAVKGIECALTYLDYPNPLRQVAVDELLAYRDELEISAERWRQDLGRYGYTAVTYLTDEQVAELSHEYAAELAARQ